MKFKIKTPYQTINKVYRKDKINRTEFDIFNTELDKLLLKIDETESEEHSKNLLRDFLKNTFYKNHEINTKNRTDLVIHTEKTSKSNIAVLFEIKKPTNKTDMISAENINKKALHETVLYYLRERIENKNNEIKHLIVTNIYTWFVFDAHDFEKAFYTKELIKEYEKWKTGQKTSKNTDLFYNEIAKPYIEKSTQELNCALFDIRQIKREKITALFKFFSATHLLKLPFKNDSNSLDTNFYNELLHLIGLQENSGKQKNTIDRKKPESREYGSLLENIILILKSEDRIDNISEVEKYGNDRESRLINVALELSITWINRILFLKLLEAQLLKYHNQDPYYKFLSYKNIPTYNELNKLFFRVLAKTPEERNGAVSPKFEKIPYLNSSLFEISKLENQTIRISSLDGTLVLTPHKDTVLKNKANKKIKQPLNFLNYIFDFLDAYDFSSEGVEEIIDESKTLINASVLGLIFEKINGYQDGSFFTPGFITMYMNRTAIRKIVVKKFTEKYKWNAKTIDDLKNYIANNQRTNDILEFNKTINDIKICDPAVGSGHFLVSALNELIAVKHDLGILADEKGVRLSAYQAFVENDELVITHNNEQDFFAYRLEKGKINKERQRIQKTLFHEKQTIIENCLFGVDINPNSVNICRLRLWIELLKNSYYEETTHGLRLQTLPNIDINIKIGNSLLSRFDIDADLSKALKSVNYSFEAYKGFVNDYKNATDKDYKKGIVKIIEQIKNNFRTEINKNDPRKIKLNKLTAELLNLTNPRLEFGETKEEKLKKKEQEKIKKINAELQKIAEELEQEKQGFHLQNAFEWRFEFPEVLDSEGTFKGFDLVIGNPPYGLYNKKQNQKIGLTTDKRVLEIIKHSFPASLGGVVNAARFFYNLGFKLLNNNGLNSMILPFGILTDITSKKLRRYIFENYSLLKIEAFPERDSRKNRVFKEVKMSTAILLSSKLKKEIKFDIGISYTRAVNVKERLSLNLKDLEKINDDLLYIPIASENEYKILKSIYSKTEIIKLGKISQCLTGEVDMTFGKPAISANSKNSKLIKGVQIDKYILKEQQKQISQGTIKYLNSKKFVKLYAGKKLIHSKNERIVLQGLTGINEPVRLKCSIVPKGYFLANSANYILPTEKIETKCLLAILNSKLINYIFKCKSTNSNVNGYEVDDLPIIIPRNQKQYVKYVDKIMELKSIDTKADTTKQEKQIDKLVYKLYNLTEEEIQIVENE